MAATTPYFIQSLKQQRLKTFNSQIEDEELSCTLWTPEIQEQFQTCWVGSDYVWEICQRDPALILQLIEQGLLWKTHTAEIYEDLACALKDCASEAELMVTLRKFRQRHQLRIIFRDLNRLASLSETTADTSAMADACIQLACDWLYDNCCQQLGTPYGALAGNELSPQKMIVLGMGKLGANELNLSSDVDLVFCYPCQGETQGAPRTLTNQEFFVRLGQRLIYVLDTRTADGFVFRVDMRLRPYGQSGALVLSNTAMEQYYQDQGRDWERYALIKARWITGDPGAAQELMDGLRPFVYRRYIDFSAIVALRDMKQMIRREVTRCNLHNNIKLGPGGIRDIEFIVQSFQLIHGGRDKRLQSRSLLHILGHLESEGYLSQVVCQQLREANTFLRNTEHALQALADKQTQTLPSNLEEQLRVAWVMGFVSWEQFSQKLDSHRQRVVQHFGTIVAEESEHPSQDMGVNIDWPAFWASQMEQQEEIGFVGRLGFRQPTEIHRKLVHFRDGKVLKVISRQGTERINRFMPHLLRAVLKSEDPDQALMRLLIIVEAVTRRTVYLVLLMENPKALEHLVSLCVASPHITEQIAHHPMLLDEFLNLTNLYAPPKKTELEDELRQQLAHIPEDDLDMQMEILRYFRMAHMLKVAASQVSGKMPLMKESDYLTWTAEVILSTVLSIAWHQLINRHGYPRLEALGPEPCFIIIGYGKLGGIELGPGSDLDLVFLHNSNPNQMTDGERSIDNSTFFARLGQRIIHMLSTNTLSGQLYDVDIRLRPSGNSGLLVSSLTAFEKYQRNEAWTWEHQALVRARCICGDAQLAEIFADIRTEVLTAKRNIVTLKKEIRDMRHKMVAPPGRQTVKGGFLPATWQKSGQFHIKNDYGGIVDIEFIVQFAVLAWSHSHPDLTRWTDNIRILENLQATGLLTQGDACALMTSYKTYRKIIHRQTLQNLGCLVSADQLQEERRRIIAIWNAVLDDTVPNPAHH